MKQTTNNGDADFSANFVKAPKYFTVHLTETFTSVNGTGLYGKAYPFNRGSLAVNVYGLTPEEAEVFDPKTLNDLLVGSREVKILWDAPSKDELMKQINDDERVKNGVCVLSSDKFTEENIEELPECQRMYVAIGGKHKDMILCGKPQNEYNDGCAGGCVLQCYDQEEEFSDGFKCPMHVHWGKQSEKFKAETV